MKRVKSVLLTTVQQQCQASNSDENLMNNDNTFTYLQQCSVYNFKK